MVDHARSFGVGLIEIRGPNKFVEKPAIPFALNTAPNQGLTPYSWFLLCFGGGFRRFAHKQEKRDTSHR
jgi:hypothetical protein